MKSRQWLCDSACQGYVTLHVHINIYLSFVANSHTLTDLNLSKTDNGLDKTTHQVQIISKLFVIFSYKLKSPASDKMQRYFEHIAYIMRSVTANMLFTKTVWVNNSTVAMVTSQHLTKRVLT